MNRGAQGTSYSCRIFGHFYRGAEKNVPPFIYDRIGVSWSNFSKSLGGTKMKSNKQHRFYNDSLGWPPLPVTQ